jgi:hypothetical protein
MHGRMGSTRSVGGRFVAVSAAGALVAAVAGAPAKAATSPAVTCTYTIQNVWSGGFTADVVIANNGPTTIDGWTLRWTFSEYTTNIAAWQSTLSAPDGIHATATNASYNGTIRSGYTTDLGWSASAVNTSVPTDLSVNGTLC